MSVRLQPLQFFYCEKFHLNCWRECMNHMRLLYYPSNSIPWTSTSHTSPPHRFIIQLFIIIHQDHPNNNMKNQQIIPSAIAILFKTLRQQTEIKAIEPQYLDIVQNHLLSLPLPKMHSQLSQEINSVAGGRAEYVLVCEWWKKRCELLLLIRDCWKAFLNREQRNRISKLQQYEQQMGKLLLLLRYYHIEIAQLILAIQRKYHITINLHYIISFILHQIQQLHTQTLLAHVLPYHKILQKHNTIKFDPFLTELPNISSHIVEELNKRDERWIKAEVLRQKIGILKGELQAKLNKNRKQVEMIKGSRSHSSNTIETQSSKMKSSNVRGGRRNSQKLLSQPVLHKKRKSLNNYPAINSNDRLIFNLKKIDLQPKTTKNMSIIQTYISPDKQQYPSSVVLKPIQKKQQENGLAQSLLDRSSEEKVLQSQIDLNQYKLKNKIYSKKYKLIRHRPEKKTLEPIEKQRQDISERIKHKQYIRYNPALKQPFDIIETQHQKYTFSPDRFKEHQASQTIQPLLQCQELSIADQEVQTHPQLLPQMLTTLQSDSQPSSMQDEERNARKLLEGRENERQLLKKQLESYVRKEKVRNDQHINQYQITIEQDCILQEQEPISQRILFRTINPAERSQINAALPNTLPFHYKHTIKKGQMGVKQMLVGREGGRQIMMRIGNYSEREIMRFVSNVQIGQKSRQLFKMDKIKNWIHKNQTYHLQFVINGKVGVEVLYSPVPNQSLILKLWATLPSIVSAQQSQHLFSKFMHFLSTQHYNKLVYAGASFPELQNNHFQTLNKNIYTKKIEASTAQLQAKSERYLNIEMVWAKCKTKDIKGMTTEDVYLDELNLASSGLGILVKDVDDLNVALEKNGLRKLSSGVKVDSCLFFKFTASFKLSFIAQNSFYHFSDVTLIPTPHQFNLLRIPIHQGFLYLAETSQLKTVIKGVGEYSKSQQYSKVRLSMRMFRKNIEGKLREGQLMSLWIGGVWQCERGLVLVQGWQQGLIFDGVVVSCVLQLSGKVLMGMLIRQSNYLR